MLDDRRVGHARIGPADLLGDIRMLLGHALDVRLVDDALVVLVLRRAVVAPVEVGVDDDSHHRVTRRIGSVALLLVTELVGEQRGVVLDLSVDRLGIRVEQELVRVASLAPGGVVRAMHAIAVALSGGDGRQVDVPDVRVGLLDVDTGLGPVVVEEAQLHAVGGAGEQGEVGTAAVVGCPERVGLTGPDLHPPMIPRREPGSGMLRVSPHIQRPVPSRSRRWSDRGRASRLRCGTRRVGGTSWAGCSARMECGGWPTGT